MPKVTRYQYPSKIDGVRVLSKKTGKLLKSAAAVKARAAYRASHTKTGKLRASAKYPCRNQRVSGRHGKSGAKRTCRRLGYSGGVRRRSGGRPGYCCRK